MPKLSATNPTLKSKGNNRSTVIYEKMLHLSTMLNGDHLGEETILELKKPVRPITDLCKRRDYPRQGRV